MKKQNIIFFFSDQQRWDTCGCYGQPLKTTPNIDQMASDGVRFENAFTCQPVCGPARACIQTGKYAAEIGCHTNNRMLPPGEKTLAGYLKESGYDTAYIGKWHLASSGRKGGPDDFQTRAVPSERRGGYEYWLASDVLEFTSHSYDGHMFDCDGNKREFPAGRYRADVLTDWAIEYLESRNSEKPFFLFVSYIEPHHQNDHHHFEGPHGSKEKFKDFVPPQDLVNTTNGDWRSEYPDYLGCINSLDSNLGRIRDALKKQGIDKNTVIIFTSDHGSHFCTRNSEYKRSCHDGCIRIPLILYGGSFTGGRVLDNMVSLIDITPTILSTAGVTVPAFMRGRNMNDLVNGNAQHWDDEVFLQISESQCGRAIRTKEWKYSVRAQDKTGNDPSSCSYTEDFLYDLKADPHEQNNLVSDPAFRDVRAKLSVRLKERMRLAGETVPEIKPQHL